MDRKTEKPAEKPTVKPEKKNRKKKALKVMAVILAVLIGVGGIGTIITLVSSGANIKLAKSYAKVAYDSQLIPEKDDDGDWTFTTAETRL